MASRPALLYIARRAALASRQAQSPPSTTVRFSARCFASDSGSPGLPDSVKRVGEATSFPNEYPGQNYAFNWSLNKDGVTPLKKSAFRITKPLDVKVAGLEPSKTSPLKVKASPATQMPEAGSDSLTFETFDEVTQRTKDLLSLSDHLYCPEGHVPGTRTGVRVISNSASLAPSLLAYLERAPRREPESQPITAYVFEGTEEEFAGYAIEEVEEDSGDGTVEAKSVAAIVVVGKKPKIEIVVAGLEQSVAGLAADEAERAEKRAEAEKESPE